MEKLVLSTAVIPSKIFVNPETVIMKSVCVTMKLWAERVYLKREHGR
jgi:hypothetical protein